MQIITHIPTLPPRKSDAHKGDFGKICIIAGSLGMSGAAAIAGRAALRTGSGLVRIATPETVLPIVAAIEPCFTTIPLADDKKGIISAKAIDACLAAAEQNDCLAFGPGIGIGQGPKTILEALLDCDSLRLIIDADGLNNLAALKNWTSKAKAKLILTPHPGEMKTLWQSLFREPILTDRRSQATTLAQRTNSVVVLKGAATVVSDSEKIFTNTTGNPGMATAGSGDVLTGIITALAGQKLSNFDAAVLGVYLHGLAGDIAAKQKGQPSLIATDIIDAIPDAFKNLKTQK